MSVRLKDLPPHLRAKVKKPRRKPTKAEQAVKRAVRGQKEAAFMSYCTERALPTPQPEHCFHPTRKWRFDWSWPDHLVALEVDGGVFLKGGGRHNRGSGYREDAAKMNEAACLGWRVLRVLPEQLYSTQTLDWIRRALEAA